MSREALKAIVLSELGMIETELSPDERIKLAIEITIRLLTIAVDQQR
jgi:hypothetical protein